jgi:hypothetical protein
MKSPEPNGVVRLFPETANENAPGSGLLFANITERVGVEDWITARKPLSPIIASGLGQAVDSTQRGFLQALNLDPWG